METNLPEIAGAKQISRRAVERRNGLSKESAADVYSWVDATRFKVHLAEFKRPNPLAGVDSKKSPSQLGPIECGPEDQSFLKSTIGSTD